MFRGGSAPRYQRYSSQAAVLLAERMI
jgi:hypothetical protein